VSLAEVYLKGDENWSFLALSQYCAWWNLVMVVLNGNFSPMAQQPLVGQGLLIIEASRSPSDTPQSVGLLWTSNQPDAETST
jgi:hypothetical protein